MTQTQTPAAQDGQAGAKTKSERRVRCSLLTVESGSVINGIRFMLAEGALFSEAVAATDEQVQRLLRLPEYTLEDVSPAVAREIDQQVRAALAAEKLVPQAPSAASEEEIAAQQEINRVVSAERDALRAALQKAEEKLAANDTKVMQADLEAKAKTIVELRADVERLTGEVQTLTADKVKLADENGLLRDANERLGKEAAKGKKADGKGADGGGNGTT